MKKLIPLALFFFIVTIPAYSEGWKYNPFTRKLDRVNNNASDLTVVTDTFGGGGWLTASNTTVQSAFNMIDHMSASSATAITVTGLITASGVNVSSTLITPKLENPVGDLKIEPNAGGDVTLFEDTDVADDADGKSLYVYRKAAEGDDYFKMYVNQWREAGLNSNKALVIQSDDYVSFGKDTKFFDGAGDNKTVRQHGYITAVTTDKYIQHQVSDTTDNYEITRQDANILGMDIQMPLITDAITSSGTITSSAIGTFGWSVQTGVNTACTTTCTSAAVFGVDSGGTGLIVGPSDATAEECLCAGGS